MSDLYDNLKRTVEDLAAPADEQEAMLRKARVGPDELALDFDAFAAAALNLVESGELSSEAYEAVRALDAHLVAFSGANNAAEWTEDALYHSSNWATARELASKVLSLMG
ncbi:hypothetical protein [Vitreimonas sp.]|uniref:hypothetical protein n=1 Tax=Vitreimonas sp. TaxID=3069702 RepID=UPI002EDA99AC